MTDTFENWVASLGGEVSADAQVFLRRLFQERGPVPLEQAQRLGLDHQIELARKAAALVAHDIASTTDIEPPPFEYRHEDGSIRLAFWGQYASSAILGLSQAAVTVEVAGFMQDEVMEDLHGVWPECSEHGNGLHPTLSVDRAEWVCRTGAHAVADIGQLSARSA